MPKSDVLVFAHQPSSGEGVVCRLDCSVSCTDG